MKCVISIDWLEYFVTLFDRDVFVATETFERDKYRFEVEPYGTRFFSRSVKICDGRFEIATIQCLPRASFINQDVALIKIANRILYCKNCFDIINDLLKNVDCRVNGITRIDLACDFIRFANGYKPHKFIKDFVCKDKNEDGYIHHYGAKEFTIVGDKDVKTNSKFNYIRFGSRKSRIQAYLYNKSKEMREEKHKAYIEDLWKANGLISDKEDVWRVEISVKSEGLKVIAKQTGELFKIGADYIETQSFIEDMFFSYARKYFRFAVKNGQKRAKDFNEIKLFDCADNVPMRPYSMSKKMDSGRTERMVSKKLREVRNMYIDLSEKYDKAIFDTIRFFDSIALNKEIVYKDVKAAEDLRRMMGYKFCAEENLEQYSEYYNENGI